MKQQRADSSLKEKFDEFLRTRQKRCTQERHRILNIIESMQVQFTADDIMEALYRDSYHVSPPTVYSTLDLLHECGILRRFIIDRQKFCYERVNVSGGVHHVHLMCTGCGKVKQVRDSELTRSIAARRWTGFTPDDYSLNIYGLCNACLRKQSAANKKAKSKSNTTK